MTAHRLDATEPHAFWDQTLAPRVHIEPGDTVVFETQEASAGQVTPEASAEVLRTIDFGRIHPLTGPVFVAGAEPDDTLDVEIVALEHMGWGWNAVIPGFGLLANEFTEPYLHHYRLTETHCIFRDDILIPYEPFCGVMGVAPRQPGRISTIPPRENGGNIDIRHLTPGARLLLPVLVRGALFSCGDCHSAQGDGEVNGTGVESPMRVTLRFNVLKGPRIPELRFVTPPGRPLTTAGDGGYFATSAHGPDLHENARQAVRYMIEHLVERHAMSREQAYCLCGAAVDLKISEIVDVPNWIVSAYLPLAIFRSSREARSEQSRASV
jgi:acetamidase/formamidase